MDLFGGTCDLFPVLLGVTIATLGVTVALWLRRRKQRQGLFERHGIPGPQPSLLFGNLMDLRKAATQNDVLTSWREKYGDVFGYYVGDVPYLVVHDLDVVKNVLIKDFAVFSDRPKFVIDTKPFKHTLLVLRGQRWKDVRSTMSPTFSAKKLKEMMEIMNAKVDTLLEEVGKKRERPFDIYKTMQALTVDVISECALAMKCSSQTDPGDGFLKAVSMFFQYANTPIVDVAIMFPGTGWLLKFVNEHLTSGQMTSIILDNLDKVIEDRRAHPNTKRKDMLQLLLNAAEGEYADPSETVPNTRTSRTKRLLTDSEIIANAYLFLLAGYETTSNALSYACYLLVKHPDLQERLYQEVSSCLRDKEHPSYYDIVSLPYLDQVLNETLRMYPPITGFITRECSKDYPLGDGRIIPEGVNVYIPVWDLHHDPDYWPDPFKFDPDRFSEENKKNIHPMTFMPFGEGPRNCLGMRFGQIEAKLALARLVLNYRLVPNELTEDNITLSCATVIINPKNGVYVTAIPRGS